MIDKKLFTPGPLSTSRTVKDAMLRNVALAMQRSLRPCATWAAPPPPRGRGPRYLHGGSHAPSRSNRSSGRCCRATGGRRHRHSRGLGSLRDHVGHLESGCAHRRRSKTRTVLDRGCDVELWLRPCLPEVTNGYSVPSASGSSNAGARRSKKSSRPSSATTPSTGRWIIQITS